MDGQDPRAGLIYDAAVRALDQQATVVESVRVRAGILLSAASVATAFPWRSKIRTEVTPDFGTENSIVVLGLNGFGYTR